jgi:hypothetical protein
MKGRMTPEDLRKVVETMYGRRPDGVGFDSAKKFAECHYCHIATANPVRVWRDGLTLIDVCQPCYMKRKEARA